MKFPNPIYIFMTSFIDTVLFPDSTEEARIQVETGGGIVQNVGFIPLLDFLNALIYFVVRLNGYSYESKDSISV